MPLHGGALLRMSAFTAACGRAWLVDLHVAIMDCIGVLAILGAVCAAEVNARRFESRISRTLTDSIALHAICRLNMVVQHSTGSLRGLCWS